MHLHIFIFLFLFLLPPPPPQARVYERIIQTSRNLSIKMVREMRKKQVTPRLKTLKMAIKSFKMHGVLEEERELLVQDFVKAGMEKEEAEEYLRLVEEEEGEGDE